MIDGECKHTHTKVFSYLKPDGAEAPKSQIAMLSVSAKKCSASGRIPARASKCSEVCPVNSSGHTTMGKKN